MPGRRRIFVSESPCLWELHSIEKMGMLLEELSSAMAFVSISKFSDRMPSGKFEEAVTASLSISFFPLRATSFWSHIMDNENRNTAESSPAPEKPPRSKVERAVVWTVIGLLILITGMEALARAGYKKTLDDFETAMLETKEPLTLNHFNSKLKSGLAIQTQGEHEGRPTILFRWPSLVKKYEMHLTVSGDDTLATYATNEGPAGLVPQPMPEGDELALASSDEGGPGFGGPMMGQGEGGPPQGQAAPGGGRSGGRNPLQQLASEPIAAELQLTEEQKTQVQDLIESQPALDPELSAEERAEQQETQRKAVLQNLKELLDETQFTRARQILLHRRGAEALTQEDVAEELKLSLEQREQIAGIIATYRENQQALFQQVQSGEIERGAIREKVTALREDANAQVLAVLTAEQKQAWETLLGPAPPEPEQRERTQRPE